ncbi:hypothetical protein D3C79_336920 [compost metagenome]
MAGSFASKIISEQYYGKAPSALTEAEKQNVSALSQLASGLAGGLIADSTAGAVGGSVAGKLVIPHFPFIIVYVVADRAVSVLQVLHISRKIAGRYGKG